MTAVYFWFSTLCSPLLSVLPAVEREGEWNCLPCHPFLHQGPQGTGQTGILVTWGRLGCGALGDRVRQNKTQQCLFAGGGSTRRLNSVSVPRLISQINLHLSTTQEEQGGSILQQLGKKWLIYQPEHRKALFHIVFL